jgi:hypothetical protein
MSVHDRVTDVVLAWAGLAELPDDSDQLKVLWTDAVAFQPDAVDQLILALKNEFTNPPSIDVELTPPDFNPPGKINTVADLATAVLEML